MSTINELRKIEEGARFPYLSKYVVYLVFEENGEPEILSMYRAKDKERIISVFNDAAVNDSIKL